jgi:hypothetical protein
MPIFRVHLLRERTVQDEAKVIVRAKNASEVEKKDFGYYDDGRIEWDCDQIEDIEGVLVGEVELVGEDEDADFELDLDEEEDTLWSD